MDLTSLGAAELARTIRDRQASSVEVVDAHLARIERYARLNAVITLDAERARRRAAEADDALARGVAWGPLHGVPFTLKDMHATAGVRTTAGLPPLRDHVPAADGIAAERLLGAGGILLGKTNMAMNVESDGELFGRPLNPWDEARTTGGSSGGAAAALAARLTPLDIGTDMSGSIRMPSHYCGVFGLKPTMHRIPAFGLVFLPKTDLPRIERWFGVSGPMGRRIEDLSLALRTLAGPHPLDPESPPVPLREPRRRPPRSLRIAYVSTIDGIPTSEEQRRRIETFAADLRAAGAEVIERPLPFAFEELLERYRALMRGPMQALADQGAGPPGSEALLKEPMSIGALAGELARRDDLIRRFEAFVADVDAWMSPTTPSEAFLHRPRGNPIVVDGDEISSQVVDHPCLLATYTGCPSLVVPIGLTSGRLPIGVQLHSARWTDDALLDVGAAIAEIAGELPAPPLS